MDFDHRRVTDATDVSALPSALARDVSSLDVDIYVDTADLAQCARFVDEPLVKGFTTNTTLMRKAGVREYREFAARLLDLVGPRPTSFGVLTDELSEMERQARTVASWGPNVFVKIPVVTSAGESTGSVMKRLSSDGIQVNVTAVMTIEQVSSITDSLVGEQDSVVSFFAGRVADTGIDPVTPLCAAKKLVSEVAGCRLLWGSARELYNVFQAEQAGCDIITVTPEILAKRGMIGKDLDELSRETVRMFNDAATDAAYSI
jgi:transaldolase